MLSAGRRVAVTNLAAQGGALLSLSVASLLVARAGGPAVVGEYALLRVLPWLTGLLVSSGLPVASAYVLAGARRADPRLRPTLGAMTVLGSLVGACLWLALAHPLQSLLFHGLPPHLIALAGGAVATQLFTVTAKACCQGSDDIGGANIVIVAEELWFLPAYGVVLLAGGHGTFAVVVALFGAGTAAAGTGIARLARRGFFAGWRRPDARPSWRLAREVAWYGARSQVGNFMWLMNLRLDFLLLAALAGPAVVGVYAVASKFAELMRLGPTALNYVLYPRFARLGRAAAAGEVPRVTRIATALTLAATPVIVVLTVVALPLLYGAQFHGAVLPACLILCGLAVEGAAAVSSAYLCGTGRPGTNTGAMSAGLVVTVGLDLLLIPSHGALGAAVASGAAYLTTTAVLATLSRRYVRIDAVAPPLDPVDPIGATSRSG